MATSSNVICNVCEAQSIKKPAIKWCAECDECFCSECLRYHSSSKFTKGHSVIDVNDFQSLPPFILKIIQYCEEHCARFQNYCLIHEQPCCSKCLNTTHKTCQDTPVLEDVVQNAKSSAALSDIERRMKNMKDYLEKQSREKQDNKKEIKEKAKSILEETKAKRMHINEHFDKLENEFLKQLTEVESTTLQQIEKTSENIELRKTKVSSLLSDIAKMKEHASDLQTFLGLKQFEKEVIKEERDIDESSKDNTLDLQDINFKENKALITFLKVNSFGEVSTLSKSSEIVFINNQQAQIFSRGINHFEKLDVIFRFNIDLRATLIVGSTLMANGTAIFSLYCEKTLLLKDVNKSSFTISLPLEPYDIAVINDRTVAITTGSASTILIVDIHDKVVNRRIVTRKSCFGICYKDGKLLFSSGSTGLKMLDLSNDNITSMRIGNKILDEYVSTHYNRIYCTNKDTNSVTCYNADKTIYWLYKSADLKGPRGINVDDDGNVYVGNQDAGNIIIISPDGKRHKVLQLETIKTPRTVCFDRQRKQLLLCGEQGPAAVYQVNTSS